jgi:hypothetical protein
MSLRNDIIKEIERTLTEIEEPRINFITREQIEIDKIAITQFPAAVVILRQEDRSTVTLGAPGVGRRQGTIRIDIRAYVRGSELDQRRNEMLEAIEEQLELDRYLGLKAQGVMDSQITKIEIVDRLAPLAELLIELEVRYNYLRGTA